MIIVLFLILVIAGAILAIKIQDKMSKELKEAVNTALNEELQNHNFEISKTIDIECYQYDLLLSNQFTKFLVDDKNKKFAIFNYKKNTPSVFTEVKYSDLINFNLYEDGEQQLQGRGVMSAVGALTFGIAGAIVGSVAGDKKIKNKCKELSVRIQINDLNNPLLSIVCLVACKKDNPYFALAKQTADNIIATLTYIENNK